MFCQSIHFWNEKCLQKVSFFPFHHKIHSLCIANVIIPPLLHHILSFVDNHWFDCCPISADGDDRRNVLLISSFLLVLCFGPSRSDHPLFPSICCWKSTLIHSIDILFPNTQFHHKFLKKIKPGFDCCGVQGLCALSVERFAPVRLECLIMSGKKVKYPLVPHLLAVGALFAFKNSIGVPLDLTM